jgi:hypothetical protein
MPLFSLICRISEPRTLLAESQQYDPNLSDYINKGRKLFDAMTPSTETAGIVSTERHYYIYLVV